MKAGQILETCLYVDDLDVAESFYSEVLGLERFARVPGRHVFLRCEGAMFLLFNPEATRLESPLGVPVHGSIGQGHVAFEMAPEDIENWVAWLQEKRVPIETNFTWPNGGRSLYFRDPSGNSVELTTRRTWGL